jgi:hypothetical protein
VRSQPGKPTDNGGHERMHADVRIDIQEDAAHSLRARQLVCGEWRAEFTRRQRVSDVAGAPIRRSPPTFAR